MVAFSQEQSCAALFLYFLSGRLAFVFMKGINLVQIRLYFREFWLQMYCSGLGSVEAFEVDCHRISFRGGRALQTRCTKNQSPQNSSLANSAPQLKPTVCGMPTRL